MFYSRYKDVVYKIIGAAMEVHCELGSGLLEQVYQEALSRELDIRNISNQREQEIAIYYKGVKMDKFYKMDLVVDDIVVELKSTKEITSEHRAQLFNYLRLTHKPIGLLIILEKRTFTANDTFLTPFPTTAFLLTKIFVPLKICHNRPLTFANNLW